MIGVLNLYKPSGITSSDAVCKVRKILCMKAVGHFGTLDPIGEGVLPLGVGKATRLFDYMLKKDKVYEAEFEFGFETDTLDRTGTITENGGKIPTLEEVEKILPSFMGKQLQMPPVYSAKSIGGKRAYELARDGKEVFLKPCEIEIFELKAVRQNNSNIFRFKIHCSSGTYIRSFGRDVARRLGTYATMISIKRLRSGIFEIADSITLEELEKKKENALIGIESALSDLKAIEIRETYYDKLLNGVKLSASIIDADLKHNEKFLLYCRGELFGLASTDINDHIAIESYLRD